MTLRSRKKPRTTVPNANPRGLRHALQQVVLPQMAILVSLISFPTATTTLAQSIPSQTATWVTSKDQTSQTNQSSFREVAASVTRRSADGLAWGASTTNPQASAAPAGHSAFSEIRTVSAVEPIRPASKSDAPKLFPGQSQKIYAVDPDFLKENQRNTDAQEHARRVALMRVSNAKSNSSRVIPAGATEDPHATPFVAGLIPISEDPFGDKVAPFVSKPAAPHYDPFGDKPLSSSVPHSNSAAPSITLSPNPSANVAPYSDAPIALSTPNAPTATRTPAPALSSPVTPSLSPQLPVAVEQLPAVIEQLPAAIEPPPVRHTIQQPDLKQMFDFNSKRRRGVRPPSPQRRLSQADSDLSLPPATPDLPSKDNPFLKNDAGDVPEFPEYEDRVDELPAPEDLGRSGDLPEVEEPPRPGGERDDAANDDEKGGLLDFPGDKDDSEEQDEEEGDDLENDLDEDDEEDDEDDGRRSPRCGRVYNDRNCCDQDVFCRNTAQKLREASIRDVNVSITPPLVPLAEDETEVEEQRERLLEAPIRSWTNRQGGLIVTGRLIDFKDEFIIVETIEGGRVSIPYYQVGYDDLCFLTAWWRLPGECLIAGDDRYNRNFAASTFTWKASAVCHKPLFFEEVQLERYGHSAGPILQPLLSGAHFISNIQLLPYNMGVYPPTECRYVLGHYRPGSCAPWLIPAFPLSNRGVAYQLGAAFGLWGIF